MPSIRSRWLYAFILGSFIAAILFLALPYYFLGADAYYPKSIPILGYRMPRTGIAWFFHILALFFLGLFITIIIYLRRKTKP
jgi:hypothetical protein